MQRPFRYRLLVLLFVVWISLISGQTATAYAAVNAYIRVNQIGYESGKPMRAYLMTSAPVSGVKAAITNSSGATIASPMLGVSTGKWNKFSVYPIDFTLSNTDTYTITVSGPVSATSPAFRVDTPGSLYATALANNLYFYENERDGVDFISTPLRTAPGHLNDAHAAVYTSPKFDDDDNILGALKATGATIDADGGWWDAGDYLKFVQTNSYVVALMLIGIRDFPRQMGGQSSSDFTNEALFGVNWLQKMWDDKTRTLYYQVGIGTDFRSFGYLSDHDIWRLPQADDTYAGTDPTFQYIRNRPVFVAGSARSKISPNLAGRLSSAFAGCYQVFEETNSTLANQCLLSAEHIFALADTSPSGDLLTTAPFDFYPENEWRDDMELGATELYFALRQAAQHHGTLPEGLPQSDANHYLQFAAHWAHAYITGPNDASDTLNLYDVSGLAHFELYRAITAAGNPAGLAVKQADLVNDIARQIANSVAQTNNDPFGFGWPWNSFDTVSHGAGLSVMAAEYANLTGNATYSTWSRDWLGNISGANAWGITLTVGDGSTFPSCMQHQVANLAGSLNGEPPVLAGAVVEGPNSEFSSGFLDNMQPCPPGGGDPYAQFSGDHGARYKDNVQSYSTDEPAIDLTASSFLMYSWRMAGAPRTIQ